MVINNSDEQVVRVQKDYYGIGSFKCIAVNPSKEQMEELGLFGNTQEKPTDGKLRLDFHFKNEDATVKYSIFLEDTTQVLPDGNKMLIDKFGNFKKETNSKVKLDEASTREARVKELDLVRFIKTVANQSGNDVVDMDIDKIYKGDLAELKDFIKQIREIEGAGNVRLLVGMKEVEKDGKTLFYSDVYSNLIGREYTSKSEFVKALNRYDFKREYPKNLEWQEFFPVKPDAEPEISEETPNLDF